MAVERVEIAKENIVAQSRLGVEKVVHNGHQYVVIVGENEHFVQPHDLSKDLKTVDPSAFPQGAYLKVKQIGKDFGLELMGRMNGGGPVAGYIAYWTTKAVCYGTAAAAATTLVVTTGGAAGAASGAAVAAGTAGASTGAGVVAGAIAGAGLAGEAAIATTAVATGTATTGGAVAAVETASLGAMAFFTWLPIP